MLPSLAQTRRFITAEEESALISRINKAKWDTTLARRVQHYGYLYDYRSPSVQKGPDIPDWIYELADKADIDREGLQVIVNEYKPGQGIGPHIDRVDLFGSVIWTLSLGCTVPMRFSRGKEKVDVKLYRRSLTVMTGDSRYKYYHSIAARRRDGDSTRTCRISITFRHVKSKYR